MKTHQLIPLFVDDADVQDKSKKMYEFIIRKFFIWASAQGKDHDKMRRSDIINYKSYLQSTSLSLPTIKNYFTVVRIFYAWANANGHHDDIGAGIKSPKTDNNFKKSPLTIDQVQKLTSEIDRKTDIGIRDYAIISLLLNNGLRRNEVATINIGDIISRNGTMGIFIKGKGRQGKDQWVILSETTQEALHQYLLTRTSTQPEEPLFVSTTGYSMGKGLSASRISALVKKRLENIGLTGKFYCCHSLRHTAATLLLESGEYDLHDVQVFMRHKNPNTTQLYTMVVEERKRMSNAPVITLEKLLKTNNNLIQQD